jgi:hypothetical protein
MDATVLPKAGETILLADGSFAEVAWCSGWSWPLGYDAPTRLYAQPLIAGRVLPIEIRVIAARDGLGRRFWIAERRTTEPPGARALGIAEPAAGPVPERSPNA